MTAALRWNNYAIDLVQSNSFVKLNRPFPNSLPPLFQSLSGRSLFLFILKEELIIITQILHIDLLWKRVRGDLKDCQFIKCHTKNMKSTFEFFTYFYHQDTWLLREDHQIWYGRWKLDWFTAKSDSMPTLKKKAQCGLTVWTSNFLVSSS